MANKLKIVTETVYGVTPPNYPEIPVRVRSSDLIIAKTETVIDAKFRFECPCCKTAYWFEVSNDETKF